MSLLDTINFAASSAQSTLAQIQGVAVDGKNGLYRGTKLLGVYGSAQVVDVIVATGGYKRRAQIPYTVTRDQFAAPPPPKEIFTRTDIAPHLTYLVDVVNVHDPLVYTLILVKNGE